MALPTVTTQAVSVIAPTTAQANGTITNTGNGYCKQRGFVYGTSSLGDPGNVAPEASSYDSFTKERGVIIPEIFDTELSGLLKNTTYYVRAYARSSAGYAYGAQVSFTTLVCIYPTSIYSPRAKINKVGVDYNSAETTTLFAPDITKLDDEVVAIETALGTDVKGTHDSVKDRFVDDEADIAAKLALAGGTITGAINLGENAGLILDTLLSDDGKYSGIVESGTAGATLAFGDLCCLDPTAGKWLLADANIITAVDGDPRGLLGICVLAGNDTDPTKMLLWGKVRAAAFPAFTVNAQLYVSETAGDITETQPIHTDDLIRVVGVALTAEDLLFNPSPDYITHA